MMDKIQIVGDGVIINRNHLSKEEVEQSDLPPVIKEFLIQELEEENNNEKA
jgi:hypothetical protein